MIGQASHERAYTSIATYATGLGTSRRVGQMDSTCGLNRRENGPFVWGYHMKG